MPTLFLLLIFMTSVMATELNSFGEFSIDTGVTGLMPAIEVKSETKEVLLTEEDKLQIAREIGMEHAQGPDYAPRVNVDKGSPFINGAPTNPTTDARQARSNHFGY